MKALRWFAGLALAVLTAAPGLADHPIDFDTEIIPVLTRHGCNAGSCHGAAVGRGGFKLSLLGSGAEADYDAITSELEGRRVNLFDPDRSLVLRKPSEQTGHEGGLVLSEESAAFNTLRQWVSEGAQRLKRRNLVDLEVSPRQAELDSPGTSVAVSVTATFDDGTRHDVTDQTVLVADDIDAVKVDLNARRLTVERRGVHVVIARYLDRVLPIRIVVPLHDRLPESHPRDRFNRVDDFVNARLNQLNLPSSPVTSDHEFLRRVTLDLSGRLPTPEQSRQFARESSNDKRSELVNRLLREDTFSQYWGLKWAGVLSIDSKQLQPEGAAAYQKWVIERLQQDAPMDETARLLLTSVGDSFVDGAVNFSRVGSSPGDSAEYATRVFMGVRLRCANCHNHPLDHWQQDDYHGLAAIFAKLKRGRVVSVSDRGEVTHPVTGQPAVPRIPGLRYLDPASGVDGRTELADWLTSDQTPYLARVTVNRLWQQLMGRGLVEPVDDMRVTNPATHPDLLDWLARDFVSNGYRLKHTIALICGSAAYQRSSAAVAENAPDVTFYSHAIARPLEAEVIADAIGDITGVPLPLGQAERAVALTDNRFESLSLDVLGRCDRTQECTTVGNAASLARSLHLINGPLINSRLSADDGRLHRIVTENADDESVLDELYQMTLSRPPSDREREHWMSALARLDPADPTERIEYFEDVLWGLMTSNAFVTNH